MHDQWRKKEERAEGEEKLELQLLF